MKNLLREEEVRSGRVKSEPGGKIRLKGQVGTLLTLDIIDGHLAFVGTGRNPEKLPRLKSA